jgi:hypothetical protein
MIYRSARANQLFAERLSAAREQQVSTMVDTEPLDWRDAAARLEREHPERWALPDDAGDPLDAFDFDPPPT